MIATIVILFFLLLFMGMPIAVMLLITTTATLAIHTNTSLAVIPQQLFNALDNSILLSIPFFILAGNVMTQGSMARRLIDVVNSFVGSFPGGLAIAGTLACLFFAALSGSSPATVVAIGSVMIPALIEAGYGEKFSIGLLTSAGSLGVVIPPSIPMILYCLVMNTSIAELFMAGIVPGLLIGGSFIAYTVYLARKNGWQRSRSVTWGERLRILKDGIWGVLLPVIVLGGIYAGVFTPTEAAAVSLVYSLLVEICIYREIGIRDVPEVCIQGAVLSGCLLFILASAMTLIWLLTSQRLPHQIADLITAHVSSGWVFLILVSILFLILGTVMDNVSAMLILSPLFAETLGRFGIDYIHYGIIMVLVIEFGFLTPPFGLNLFIAMGLTDKSLVEVSNSIWPFLAILLFCLLLVTFIPQISLFLPGLLLR
ncbi:TRAP transporter large permease [Desulfomonile tiedjei]|uniref:TRAP transporter, DctM subunit n=1 Tax=Desulfomonile tiedjei (strain ATCC 49306 / DSM 6799 / DCB-1) TaxID=706587 RepID=I4CDE9_DESTA|nr:TRAP transporter large permease [Desulfomonile tiedjei]AFM27590.1 TRAP transporter, DctM subunit [Desulfomonile tiedjei DSM 6799]